MNENGHSNEPLPGPGEGPGKRVLWYSNAPWAATGYGNQTGLICATLPQYGHPIAVLANYGLMGTKLDIQGVKVYPGGRAMHSNDIVQAMADDWKADVIISLYDAWVLKFADLPDHHTPWVAWVPIDHETIPQPVLASLRQAQGVVAFSRHGQQALQAAGVEAAYIPHGVDTNLFSPGDQNEARKEIGFPENTFLAGMVAANTGYPSRKCIPEALNAFRRFHADYPDSLLYLHMRTDESNQGVDVHAIIESLGLKRAVVLCDQYQLQLGYPASYMAQLYRAFDVLLNPSRGEGFGIPILESLACGTPVIATDTTAMAELVEGAGWLVGGEPFWSSQGAWQLIPGVAGIANALFEACDMKTASPAAWDKLKQSCADVAQDYDFARVVAPMWDAYLRAEAWKTAPARLSVITPWKDHPELIPLYERAVQGADEVVIVDNASEPETAHALAALAARLGGQYIRNEANRWFSRACNDGAERTTGNILLFLNNDIAAPPGWLDDVRRQVRPGALYGPSQEYRPVENFDIPGGDVPYIEGWCLAVHRQDWETMQGFDDEAYPLPYYEDTDLSFRAVEEWGLRLEKTAWPVIHLKSVTTGSLPEALSGAKENQATFMGRVRAARGNHPIFKVGEFFHEHNWAATGLFIAGKLCVQCKEAACSAGLVDVLTGRPHLERNFFPLAANGVKMAIEDDPDGGVAKIVCKEIELSYDLDSIPFEAGDVVLDIGAHVGVVSIYLAKRHPEIEIIAFEPVTENYLQLLKNRVANQVTNVSAHNQAVTGDGRQVCLGGDFHENTGGISILKARTGTSDASADGYVRTSASMRLKAIFDEYGLERVKLLKIDCEGAEYEIFRAEPELLSRVDYLRGEFHAFPGHDPDELLALCRRYIRPENIRVSISKMAAQEAEHAR